MRHYKAQRPSGMALVIVMMALSLLAVVTLSVVTISNQSLLQSKMAGESDEAYFAAQAGLALKFAQFNAGDNTDIEGTLTESDAFYKVNVYEVGDTIPEVPGLSPVPDGYVYMMVRGYDRDPDGGGPAPREVRMGVLFRQAATVFTAAALAGDKLTFGSDTYTDTYSSTTGAAGDHGLAHVGVFNASGEIDVQGSIIGSDDGNSGTAVANANLVVPTGFTGPVSGTAGTDFVSQITDPFLSAPDPVPPRTAPSGPKIDTGVDDTIYPTLVGSEWVIQYEEIKVHSGATLTIDVSAVPHDETVYVDVKKFNMDDGKLFVVDGDELLYGSGATEVSVQLYAMEVFDVVNGGEFKALNDEPKRMVAYSDGEMRLNQLSASHMVGRARTKVEVKEGSEIFGSILSDGEVLILDDSRVHYDEELQSSGSGATGGGSLRFVSYQRL